MKTKKKGKRALAQTYIGERRGLLEAIVRSGVKGSRSSPHRTKQKKERQHELGHRVMGKKYFVKQDCLFEEKSYGGAVDSTTLYDWVN